MFSKKCSYRHNKKARATQFKKGHKCNWQHLQTADEEHTVVSPSTYGSGSRVTRPSRSEFIDACQISANAPSTSNLILPSKLRPEKDHEEELTGIRSEENVVVNLGMLSNFVVGFTHPCMKPVPEVKVEKRQGLCITASTFCITCGFKSSSCKLFTSIKKKPWPRSRVTE